MPSTGLILPSGTAPMNLNLPEHVRAQVIEHDLYNICERIKEEVSRRLEVVVLEEADRERHCFAVMEHCDDGVVRLVKKYRELDGRVIEDLKRMLSVPFEKRFEIAEREAQEAQRKMEQEEMDRLVEDLGLPMRRQLWHDGFTEHRNKSYPTLGVTSRGRRAR